MIIVPKEFVLDILIVLDDAIVHADHRFIITDVRMCVVLAWFAMGRPARMSDSAAALHGQAVIRLLHKALQSSLDLDNFKIPVTCAYRKACRIISAVFQFR